MIIRVPHSFCMSILVFFFVFSATQAKAEIELGSLNLIATPSDSSPIPRGLLLGGIGILGQARYSAQDRPQYLIPGMVYLGEDFMYLGDRARYYLYKEGNFALYGFGRVRLGNLDAETTPEFKGLQKRKWELEAGIGANWITPYALFTARIASDITGTSQGQEILLWADFPIVRERFLFMPGLGMMIRSSKLANYYFGGVNNSEATSSRPAYDTGHTVSPMASLISSYRINKNWIAMAAISYEQYDQSVRHSPIVQHRGELYSLFGLGYHW